MNIMMFCTEEEVVEAAKTATLLVGVHPASQHSDAEVSKETKFPGVEAYLYFMYGSFAVHVTNKMITEMNLSQDTAWEKAIQSTVKNAKWQHMFPPLNILTNERCLYGAGILIDADSILCEFAKKNDANQLVVIPSSKHEVLVMTLPSNNLADMTKIVREVNEEAVEEKDRLADTAYLYDCNSGEVTVL